MMALISLSSCWGSTGISTHSWSWKMKKHASVLLSKHGTPININLQKMHSTSVSWLSTVIRLLSTEHLFCAHIILTLTCCMHMPEPAASTFVEAYTYSAALVITPGRGLHHQRSITLGEAQVRLPNLPQSLHKQPTKSLQGYTHTYICMYINMYVSMYVCMYVKWSAVTTNTVSDEPPDHNTYHYSRAQYVTYIHTYI